MSRISWITWQLTWHQHNVLVCVQGIWEEDPNANRLNERGLSYSKSEIQPHRSEMLRQSKTGKEVITNSQTVDKHRQTGKQWITEEYSVCI